MINYLKESTFAVNDVIQKAWRITIKHYFSIATLCFLMFITASASSLLAFFISDVSKALSILMAVIFVFLYFTINLSLFKYIFHLMDDENSDIKIVDTLPTRQQIIRFLLASLYFVACIVGVYLVVVVFAFPFIYTPINFQTVKNVAISVGIVAIFITWLRISFFPFFIIDKNSKPFESIKLSLATTKGNFTKILLLLIILGGGYLIYLLLNYLHLPLVALVVNILSSFIIVPLSSVALTVAYRKMMDEYTGDAHPDILHNIV